MAQGYEINELAKEDSWRMFRIIGELVEGFDELNLSMRCWCAGMTIATGWSAWLP